MGQYLQKIADNFTHFVPPFAVGFISFMVIRISAMVDTVFARKYAHRYITMSDVLVPYTIDYSRSESHVGLAGIRVPGYPFQLLKLLLSSRLSREVLYSFMKTLYY